MTCAKRVDCVCVYRAAMITKLTRINNDHIGWTMSMPRCLRLITFNTFGQCIAYVFQLVAQIYTYVGIIATNFCFERYYIAPLYFFYRKNKLYIKSARQQNVFILNKYVYIVN